MIDRTVVVDDVYRDMTRTLISFHQSVQGVISRVTSRRGKGVRPVFMAMVADSLGGSWQTIRPAAGIIEAIHIASLIHDDIIDEADLRRGAATLNARFTGKAPVLFGDFVFVKALSAAHDIDDEHLIRIVYRAVGRMVDGELAESLTGVECDEETYFRIVADKTGALFSAAGEIGALLSGVDDRRRAATAHFGEVVGTVFQVIDDILDVIGETDATGKRSLMDLAAGRMTLPVIHALRNHTPAERNALLDSGDEGRRQVLSLLNDEGGVEYAYTVAQRLVDEAQRTLGTFAEPHAAADFDEFFDMMMSRAG